jgi:flagellar hook-basal body complex protein FliE
MLAAVPLVASTLAAVGGSTSVSSAGSAVSGAGGDTFSSMLAKMAQDTVGSMNNAEQMSVAGIEGKASTQSVVEAVMSAQESLQTALAVRDKAVAAYQDITRMSI